MLTPAGLLTEIVKKNARRRKRNLIKKKADDTKTHHSSSFRLHVVSSILCKTKPQQHLRSSFIIVVVPWNIDLLPQIQLQLDDISSKKTNKGAYYYYYYY